MGKKTKVGKTRKDKFYKLAKETGFRSRSAFKLIQLNRKFGFLQQSQVCIDLCAAPGGWMQVAKQNMPVSSIVVGVDLYPIKAIPGCIGLVEDITTDKCKTSLSRELQTWKADVVLHDGAPNVGKNWLFDAYQQICLTLQSLKLATNFLRSNGWFVTKVFRSKDYNALLWVLKQLFKKVHATKPSASRKESAEIFVVCQGYLAPTKIDPKLLDAKYVFEELDLDGQKKSTLLQSIKLKRVKAEGYTDKEMAMRNELSCIEFMENDNGLAALQGISNIIIDHDGVKKHPKTTIEILECCKDIKVLGRKEIKGLLLWHKHIKADLFKKPEEKVEKIIEKVKEDLTPDEIEELEMEKLDKQIADLVNEEQRDAKRKKKKVLKEKTKLNERMNLKMVIKGDHGPREEGEDGVFDLKEIKTGEDLDDLQDVAPDHVAETTEINGTFIPKYKKYDKDVIPLDEDGLYEDKNFIESDYEPSEESDFDRDGLGLSDKEDDDGNTTTKKLKNKKKKTDHPLIRSGDFRDKDTKRQQRVQLWYEKDNLQQMESDDDDEEYDLDKLAKEYQTKGVEVLGIKKTTTENKKKLKKDIKKSTTDNSNKTVSAGEKDFFSNDNDIKVIGKKAKRKARHDNDNKSSSSSESSDTDDNVNDEDNDNKITDKGLNGSTDKVKKIRLNESELAIGAMMIKGKKTKRDLIDSAWNRYVFNDNNLPEWFVQDEDLHMRKPVPVPPELLDEYNNKVLELNARPIKKVMEAKARKKRRATKRMEKAKKKAEQIMEHSDGTAQDKMRQIRKLYKKAEDKKKEISYVVARKHLSGKRVRRPPGVKGRFRVVDPRQKKDKRSVAAKEKKNKKGKRK